MNKCEIYFLCVFTVNIAKRNITIGLFGLVSNWSLCLILRNSNNTAPSIGTIAAKRNITTGLFGLDPTVLSHN
jgi:hypothetical protein